MRVYSAWVVRCSLVVSFLSRNIIWYARADPRRRRRPILPPLAPVKCCESVKPVPEPPPGSTASVPPTLCEFVEFPSQLCRCAGTASPVRVSGSVAGMRRSRCTSTPSRSTIRPGALRRCHRRRHAAAGRSHAAWRLTAAAGVVQIQPPLPDGGRTRTCGRRSTWCGPRRRAAAGRPCRGSRRNAIGQPAEPQISEYLGPVPRTIRQLGGVTAWPTASPVGSRRCRNRSPAESAGGSWAGGPRRGWNKPPTPATPDQLGEMSIRQIDGQTVLSYFNASTGNMVRSFTGVARRRG